MISNFVLPMRNVLSKKIMISVATADNVNAAITSTTPDAGHCSDNIEGQAPEKLALIKKAKSDGNPAESFYMTSLLAAYFLFPFWLGACIVDFSFLGRIFSRDALTMSLLSGLMHSSYNLSSFGFLSRVTTPTTHAIANVFKRVFTIWTAIVFFGSSDDNMSPLTVAGLAVSSLGLFWYGSITAGSKKG